MITIKTSKNHPHVHIVTCDECPSQQRSRTPDKLAARHSVMYHQDTAVIQDLRESGAQDDQE